MDGTVVKTEDLKEEERESERRWKWEERSEEQRSEEERKERSEEDRWREERMREEESENVEEWMREEKGREEERDSMRLSCEDGGPAPGESSAGRSRKGGPGAGQRRQVLQSMARPLKLWLYQHRDNPYPTKTEKLLLALASHMTLVQVSNWFANARRRLKNTVRQPDLSWALRIQLYEQLTEASSERPSSERLSPERLSPERLSPERTSSERLSSERPSSERPSAERTSSERPSSERPSPERPSSERPSSERPSAERTSSERPSSERPSPERLSSERPSPERLSSERPSPERPSSERTSQSSADTHSDDEFPSATPTNQSELNRPNRVTNQESSNRGAGLRIGSAHSVFPPSKYKSSLLHRYLNDSLQLALARADDVTGSPRRGRSQSISSIEADEELVSPSSSLEAENSVIHHVGRVGDPLPAGPDSGGEGQEDKDWREIHAAMSLTNLAQGRRCTTGPISGQSCATGPISGQSCATGPISGQSCATGPISGQSCTTGPIPRRSCTTGPIFTSCIIQKSSHISEVKTVKVAVLSHR